MTSLHDRLPGTYRLVSLLTTTTTGEVSRPMGDQPTGMFVFDRAGNYSVQLTSTGAGDRPAMAMFGRYRIDDDAATFVLSPEAATDPNLVGTDVVRHVTLRDDLGVFETRRSRSTAPRPPRSSPGGASPIRHDPRRDGQTRSISSAAWANSCSVCSCRRSPISSGVRPENARAWEPSRMIPSR